MSCASSDNTPQAHVASLIGNAETWVDPLDDLVRQTGLDAGAPFTPEALDQLAQLQQRDVATFEKTRARLKDAGCRVGALDRALAAVTGDCGGVGAKQADILIDLARAADLFHAPDGTALGDLDVTGHRETWPLRSKGFRRWLARRFFEATGGAPNAEALQSALNVLDAKAHFDAPERPVYVRIGGLEGRLYLDLGDEQWRAVEIDAAGWRLVDRPPVRFRRAAGMLPLPIPQQGGSIDALRSFLNVRTDEDFVLVVSWILACLRDRGPYPLLVLSGEQGSAKSTFSAMVRALIDPNTAPLRALPREDRDLFIAATNGHLLTFDNVSGLPAWMSDTLCRLATGGGFAVRQLYTDQDEVLFDATRPIVLNGIEDIVTRPDLADRAIFLTLQPIPEERRKPEAELWAAFEACRSQLLGVLLDGIVEGLRRVSTTTLPGYPRMADFARWAVACERAWWSPGTFWAAYAGNREAAVESVLDADSVAGAVRVLMTGRDEWSGTASDLLEALQVIVGERVARSRTWPDGAKALSGRVRRSSTFLRKVGIDTAFSREGRSRTRTIRFTTALSVQPDADGTVASASSAPSAEPIPAAGAADPAVSGPEVASASASVEVPSVSRPGDRADRADAAAPRQSARGVSDVDDVCCDGTPLKLSCKLCRNSPTYWCNNRDLEAAVSQSEAMQ